jgi:hypothetical protein
MSEKREIVWNRTSELMPPSHEQVLVRGGIAYFRPTYSESLEAYPGWYTITGCDHPGRLMRWIPAFWALLPEPPGPVEEVRHGLD